MDFTFNVYALILLLCGKITLLLSYYVYKKEGGAVRLFGIMMFTNAIWSIAYGLELASTSLSQIIFFINIEYIGISTLPLSWFLFCLHLSGKEKWYKRPFNFVTLMVITIATILTVWTNNWHHLYYTSITVDNSSYFPMAKIATGIGYHLFTIYFYILLAIGNYLLFAKFRTADPIYRRQNYLIIVASLIPWIANITYLAGIRPLGNLDMTPFAFVATISLIAVAIYRFKLFDIVPIAREKVMDLMQDGFVILDNKKRVIDYNLAFKKYLGRSKRTNIIGATLEELLPGQTDFHRSIENRYTGHVELKLSNEFGVFDLDVDIRCLDNNQPNSDATIVKMQDLTQFKKDAIKSKEQTEELKRLNQLKDRIFSIIAHDLRAPLVNLSEVLKMISDDEISPEEFKMLAPILSKDIIYTTDLLENILHWSRSQLKGFGINKGFFDLKGLVVDEVTYHMPSARAKNITIVQDVFPGAMIYADMLMIQIVIRNILNNAIKFCYDTCEIKIFAVYTKEHFIKLCIEDNGTGMEKIVLESLFSGENKSRRGTKDEKGTGLGMVVCKEFMERNDGKISVRSEISMGTKICLHLPVDESKN
ncbi:MAG: PAS domain-containing sensor histidine kinase [Pedobacter sp.]|nr:PAS domain-containing sensor histidine kinase [Pedobacter sp.]